jgi:hypothetical protein
MIEPNSPATTQTEPFARRRTSAAALLARHRRRIRRGLVTLVVLLVLGVLATTILVHAP